MVQVICYYNNENKTYGGMILFETLDNLFDLNSDGNLDLGEQALENDVIFNDDIIGDDLDSDFDFIDDFEDTDDLLDNDIDL